MGTLSSPSAPELLASVRNMLGQPNATNSNWSDDELLTYLNEGVRRYFTEVVQNGNGEFNTTTELDITADTETVALPSDFFQVRALYRNLTNGKQVLPFQNNL